MDRSVEALRALKPDEAKALMLRAHGLSYQEIGRRFGWTYTKVNCGLSTTRRLARTTTPWSLTPSATRSNRRRPSGVRATTRARLERLIRGPDPDHVARSTFFLGVLQYEDGRFGEALEHFKTFAARFPTDRLYAKNHMWAQRQESTLHAPREGQPHAEPEEYKGPHA